MRRTLTTLPKEFADLGHGMVTGWVLAACLISPALAHEAITTQAKVPVSVKVMGCAQDAPRVPDVSVDFTDFNVKPESPASNVFLFKMPLAQGLHRFLISTPTCYTRFHTVVLDGHPRYIVIQLQPYVLMSEEHTGCALAGVLPFNGLTVSLLMFKGSHYHDLTVGIDLTSPEDVTIPATLDHGAYYVDDLFPGEYKLEVGYRGQTFEIPLNLNTTNGPRCEAFERDITSEDLAPEPAPSPTHQL